MKYDKLAFPKVNIIKMLERNHNLFQLNFNQIFFHVFGQPHGNQGKQYMQPLLSSATAKKLHPWNHHNEIIFGTKNKISKKVFIWIELLFS